MCQDISSVSVSQSTEMGRSTVTDCCMGWEIVFGFGTFMTCLFQASTDLQSHWELLVLMTISAIVALPAT